MLKPIGNKVLVKDLERGILLSKGGVIMPDDDMKESGIRPRWGTVYAVGPKVTDLSPGDHVLISHGRWTRGIDIKDDNGNPITIRLIDYPEAVLLISSEDNPKFKEFK